ncbi:MAG: hypothetical protein H7345_18650 [Rubritepida sp.]|nr:hypothetical protein [Rubritepida sp.]
MPDTLPTTVIEDAVRQVLASISGDLSMRETQLLGELEGLGQEIARAKREMAALQVHDINANHIPVATDELDAVLGHTAAATNEILDCCEGLEKLADGLAPEPAAAVAAGGAPHHGACSFQDITGQRIAKVVSALKGIEARLGRIGERFGTVVPVAPAPPAAPVTQGRALANGPQMPGAGTSQADIDRMLASFD